MNATKIYIIMFELVMLSLVVGITVAAIHFNKYGLLWWYLLPGLCCSLEVSSKK